MRFAGVPVRRRVQCSVASGAAARDRSRSGGRKRLQPRRTVRASTSSFRRPLDLKFPASSISFSHFFLLKALQKRFEYLLVWDRCMQVCLGLSTCLYETDVCRSVRVWVLACMRQMYAGLSGFEYLLVWDGCMQVCPGLSTCLYETDVCRSVREPFVFVKSYVEFWAGYCGYVL